MENSNKFFTKITRQSLNSELQDLKSQILENEVTDYILQSQPFYMLLVKETEKSINFLKTIYPSVDELRVIESKLPQGRLRTYFWKEGSFFIEHKTTKYHSKKAKLFDKSKSRFVLQLNIYSNFLEFENFELSRTIHIWKLPDDYFLVQINPFGNFESSAYKADGLRGLLVLLENIC